MLILLNDRVFIVEIPKWFNNLEHKMCFFPYSNFFSFHWPVKNVLTKQILNFPIRNATFSNAFRNIIRAYFSRDLVQPTELTWQRDSHYIHLRRHCDSIDSLWSLKHRFCFHISLLIMSSTESRNSGFIRWCRSVPLPPVFPPAYPLCFQSVRCSV